jgi:hypothetical protein
VISYSTKPRPPWLSHKCPEAAYSYGLSLDEQLGCCHSAFLHSGRKGGGSEAAVAENKVYLDPAVE